MIRTFAADDLSCFSVATIGVATPSRTFFLSLVSSRRLSQVIFFSLSLCRAFCLHLSLLSSISPPFVFFSLSLLLSVYLTLVSLCVSLCLPFCSSLSACYRFVFFVNSYFSGCLSVHLSVCQSLLSSTSPPFSLILSLSIRLFNSVSFSLSFCSSLYACLSFSSSFSRIRIKIP